MPDKDINVLSFLTQMIQEKHGDDASLEFLEVERERLYIEFGDFLLAKFEPLLSEEAKIEFAQISENYVNQDEVFQFLVNSIEDLETKIVDAMYEYKDNYIKEKDS